MNIVNNVYLELPSMEHKEACMDMLKEWSDSGEKIYPGALRMRGMNYLEWLDYIKFVPKNETNPPNLVPSDTYFLINDDDNIIGAISIRHYLNDYLLNYGGHIGYGIRPSKRRKGYAKLMLKLALGKCQDIAIDKVLITCNKDNIASAKTILANGGVLENEIAEENGNIVQRYWIQV